MEKLKFPVLFRYGNMIVPAGIEALKYWELKHIGGDKYISKESFDLKSEYQWFIDSDAKLRIAKRIGTKRKWARIFRYIWSFSKGIYELEPGRTTNVGELLDLLKRSNGDAEKSSARSFKRYLKKFSPETTFTVTMFREYMHEDGTGEIYYP